MCVSLKITYGKLAYGALLESRYLGEGVLPYGIPLSPVNLNCRPRVLETHREIFRCPQVTGDQLFGSLPSLGSPDPTRGHLEHFWAPGRMAAGWTVVLAAHPWEEHGYEPFNPS